MKLRFQGQVAFDHNTMEKAENFIFHQEYDDYVAYLQNERVNSILTAFKEHEQRILRNKLTINMAVVQLGKRPHIPPPCLSKKNKNKIQKLVE